MQWRTVGRVAATVLVGLLVPVAVAAVGIAGATGEIYTARDPSPPPAPVATVRAPTHDPGRPTAVVLLAPEGANAAGVLAEAGLLDGRPATSHWLGLIGLRRDYPAVRWTDGVRYVDDGDLITTAGVLSGVDGALRVVERLVGPAAARAARAVGWPAYSPGGPAAIRRSRPAPPDLVAALSAGYRWDRPRMGCCSPTGLGRPSWPRRSGPTPSCRTWPARWR
jgi:putative intracellular protease/amidase